MATHLSLSLTRSSGSVTRVAVGKEESNSVVDKDTLFHWETLEREAISLQFINIFLCASSIPAPVAQLVSLQCA